MVRDELGPRGNAWNDATFQPVLLGEAACHDPEPLDGEPYETLFSPVRVGGRMR